jgi:hypothetical protein
MIYRTGCGKLTGGGGMSTIPQEFNWVEKRADCTSHSIFLQLVAGVAEDVKTRNTAGSDANFASDLTSDKRALVIGQIGVWARKEKVRIFPLEGKIEVRDEVKNASFSAEVFLNNEGRCKLKLEDGTELEQWQFRRMALEGIFFGD